MEVPLYIYIYIYVTMENILEHSLISIFMSKCMYI